ncbi:MAG TPA: hypothetical protein VGW98_00040 [Solirubrobacteraceae bacterium]|nr:hypothetical protein [Solirubrobacteraceae bacterium]
MISRRVLLLTAVVVLAMGGAPALAAPADVATTRTYVQANYALVRYAAMRLGTARSLLDGVLNKARADCPSAAAGSPQNPESTMVSYEIIGAMVLAAYHAAQPQINAYIRVATRSRWSSRALTSSVHAYAGKLTTLSTLAAPNLCADIRAWSTSGYKALPASTVRFDQLFVPAWVSLGEVPAQLASYERPDERGTLQRSGQAEEKLTNFEAEAVETYNTLMNTLAVNP